MSPAKEKYTKEQMMRLLDRAIEQEESLLEKVKILESALAECRKKAENPRHELEEQALPGSKVSFRLDYYRTEKKGPLKGIIEHLPTRESRSFEGNQLSGVVDFVAKFVGKFARKKKVSERPTDSKTPPNIPLEMVDNAVEEIKEDSSPLPTHLASEISSASSTLPPAPSDTELTPIASPLEPEPFKILTEGKKKHQRTMRKGEPFQIQIPMQTLGALQGKPCSVSMSAKSLEKKITNTIEIQGYYTPNHDGMIIPVQPSLEQGVYRWMVSVALRDEPQKAYYREERLLIVQ